MQTSGYLMIAALTVVTFMYVIRFKSVNVSSPAPSPTPTPPPTPPPPSAATT